MVMIKDCASGVKQGQQIGKREILGPPFRVGKAYEVVARCECGNVDVVRCDKLSRGKAQCCYGCKMHVLNQGKAVHGGKGTKLFHVWKSMRRRCRSIGCRAYKNYGGRGITLCEEWANSFVAFRQWAISNGYASGLQIDRKNNNDGYNPSNCRFVTCKQNNRNRRDNVFVNAFEESKTIAEWAEDERCQVKYSHLWSRLCRNWAPEQAIVTPSRKHTV